MSEASSPRRWQTAAAVVTGLLLGAMGLWLLQLMWQKAAEYDRNPTRPNVKRRMMLLKSDAMHDVLDEMIAGRMDHVAAAAAEIRQHAATIDGFLATEVYEKYGEEFFTSLDDLTAAADRNDREAAKEATLRLESACIDCHFLIQAEPVDPLPLP